MLQNLIAVTSKYASGHAITAGFGVVDLFLYMGGFPVV